MARRHAARGRTGGGERIQAARQPNTRVATAVASVAVAAAAAIPAAALGGHGQALWLLAGAAGLFLLVGLSGRPSVVPLALVALGTLYLAAWGGEGGGVDGRAPLYGGALLLVAELAYWSLETDAPTVDDPGVRRRRLGSVVVLAGAGAAVGALLVALTAVRLGGGVGTDALGVAAAAAAFVAVVALARRR